MRFGSIKLWETLHQHKAGLAIALLCGTVVGSALTNTMAPAPTKEASLTPIAALFQSAGWSTTDATSPIAAITDGTNAPEPADTSILASYGEVTDISVAAAAVADDNLEIRHGVMDTPHLAASGGSSGYVPATAELINALRPTYTAQSSGFMGGPDLGSTFSNSWIPSDALAAPAIENSGILRSVVSASVAKVNVTQGRAVILNLKEPVSRLTISNSGVAKATLISPSEIQIIGQSLGVANLVLWPSLSGEQQVIDITVHRDLSLLRSQLQAVDGRLNVVPSGDDGSVALTGNVSHSETAQYALELASNYFNGSSGGSQSSSSSSNSGSTSSASGSSAPPASASANSKGTNIINLITVNGQPTSKLSLVRQKLKSIHPNIQLDIVKSSGGVDKAVLSGHVPSSEIVSQAINTAAVVYGQPGIKVVTGPGGNQVSSKADDAFQKEDAFSTNLANNVLQGTLVTDTSGNVVSLMTVAERPQIRCTIQFLEINRNDLNQLGATAMLAGNGGSVASFSGNQGNPTRTLSGIANSTNALVNGAGSASSTVATSVTEALGSGATQIFTLGRDARVALTALVEKRQVRSLAEPTLTMLSGEKASFLAGGEVPVPVALINGQVSVQFKDFGIRMNLIPTVLKDDQINLQIAPEVSAVDTTIFVNAGQINIPGFRTRRMQTTLEVMDGEQIVLAGLFNNEDIRVASRFPILGQVPVLGALFRNKNRDSDKTEMIVILRPVIVKRTVADPALDDATTAKHRKTLTTDLQKAKDEKSENIRKHLLP